jgi:hypothetical protein
MVDMAHPAHMPIRPHKRPKRNRHQPGGKHAQLEPHGPGGKSSPRVDDAPRDGAATIDSNLLSFELPHCGHFG